MKRDTDPLSGWSTAGGGVAPLDRDSPVPLYHQLETALLRLIGDAALESDSPFPSENRLAAEFGVTRPTVRQALDRLVRIGVLRRERGRGTYVANVPATSVDKQARFETVKVVMPSLDELIHLRVLSGIVDEAHDEGLRVLLAHSDNRADLQDRELDSAADLAGVLLWPVSTSPKRDTLERLRHAGLPVVFVDRYLDSRSDRVVIDDELGAFQAVDHLAGLGHRRIAFVYSEDPKLSSIRLRRRGYRRALAERGIDIDDGLSARVDQGSAPPTSPFVDDAVELLVNRSDPPTAAFCVNDVLAVAVLGALERRRVAVPRAFSVAGFDALESLSDGRTLTSVHRATEEMGRLAVRILAARIRSGPDTPSARHIELPTELVEGDTTARAPRTPRGASRPRAKI